MSTKVKTMMVRKSFIVLIFMNLAWSTVSECVRTDEASSPKISPQSAEEFVEGTSVLDLDASPKELSAEERCIEPVEEDTLENASSEEVSSGDGSLDEDTPKGESPQEVNAEDCDHLVKLNNSQIELAKRRRPVSQPWHPNNTEFFYEYDEDGRVFNPSIKYCAFFGQLIGSTTAFLSLVPKNASEREARLNRSMHNEWKHRIQVVDDIVEKLIITPTSETFARFWRAFRDLDIRVQNSTMTEKKAPPNALKKLLTKLTTVTTLQEAEAVWREDILFWARASTRARQVILFGEAKTFSLSPVQRRIIREFTKLTPVDELNRRRMLKYPFFSAMKKIPDSATRMDLMTEIYLSCLWIMRVEHQDSRVVRLIHYLTTTWREVGILEEETDQLFVMHSFCIGISELHLFYNVIDVPCSRKDGADVQLTRHEYNIYLNFIRRKFRSRINRDTARITLATFYNNGQGPIKLYE